VTSNASHIKKQKPSQKDKVTKTSHMMWIRRSWQSLNL